MSAGMLPPKSANTAVPEFDALLRSCRLRMLTHVAARGLADLLIIAVTATLLFGVLDYSISLPVAGRVIAFGLTLLAMTWVTWTRLIAPLTSSVTREELGAAVDMAFPELHEGMATLVSLSGDRATADEAGSRIMRQQIHRQVASQISHVSTSRVVDSAFTLRRCGFAVIAGLAFLVPCLLWPDGSQLVLRRLMFPLANLQAPTNLYFEVPDGNRTVATGSTVHFTAIPRWHSPAPGDLPTNVTVKLTTADGMADTLPMLFDDVRQQYLATLPSLQQSLRYRIQSGRTQTAWFVLQAEDAPELTAVSLIETPPGYTGRPVTTIEGVVGAVSVFEYSDIEIRMQFSKPVRQADLIWNSFQPIQSMIAENEFEETPTDVIGDLIVNSGGADGNSAAPPTNADGWPTKIMADLSEDRLQATVRFQALGSGAFQLNATDDFDLTLPGQPDRRLTVVEDKPPVVQVTGLPSETEVRPDDIVPLDSLATDDLGLASMELFVTKNDEATRIFPADTLAAGDLTVAHEFRLPLQQFSVKEGDVVSLTIKTTDTRPIPQPHLVISGPWTLQIHNDAKPLGKQQLSEENQQMIDALRQLADQLTEDVETGNTLRNQLWKQWDQTTQDGVSQLSEKEQLQGRQLQTVAEQMAGHPLMTELAEQLQQIGTSVREEVPAHLADAVAAQRDDAAKSLQQGINLISKSRDQLRRLIRELEQIARIEQDLTELNRLALEAEQLAKQADELQREQQQPQPPPGQSADERQAELQQRQQQLDQDQQDLSDDLDSLLQRQQELREAARRSQLEKLEDLAKQTQQLASQQQLVADGVAEESRDVARDAALIADQLQQMNRDSAELMAELKQSATDAPLPRMDTADDAARSLRQGNLQQAKQNVADLEQQLQSTADQLKDQSTAPDGIQKRNDLANQVEQISGQLRDIQQQIEQLQKDRGLPAHAPQSSENQQPPGPTDQAAPNTPNQSQSDQNQSEARGDSGQQAESGRDNSNNSAENKQQQQQQQRDGQQQPGAQQPGQKVVEDLIDRLRQLNDANAAIAQSLAAETQANPPANPEAARAVQRGAQQAEEAMAAANAGQFSKSAANMREAAAEDTAAAGQMAAENRPDQQGQLNSISSELQQLAEMFQRLQQDDAAQIGAQRSSQQQVTQQAQALPEQLSELAERLSLEALGLQQQGRQAEAASQAAQQASQSTAQASRQLENSQLQQAAQSGHEAAGQLNRAAQLAQQGVPQQQSPASAIPSDVGESVTDALTSLQRAAQQSQANRQQMQQDRSASQGQQTDGQQTDGQPLSGQPGDQQAQGQSADQTNSQSGNQPGQTGNQPGQAGDQQSGNQGQPSQSGAESSGDSQAASQDQAAGSGASPGPTNAMSHSTDDLADAAEALKNAAKGALPADFTPGQMADNSKSSGKAQSGTGNDQQFDGRTPGSTARGGRRWFAPGLVDELNETLSDQGRDVVDTDYAELIRNYRRQLAQAAGQNPDSEAATEKSKTAAPSAANRRQSSTGNPGPESNLGSDEQN